MDRKTKLVLADLDTDYIIPLQISLAKDYSEQIEIEIITDKSYFNNYFSQPQDIDILIISDELLNASINRHNIENIFVLTEQNVEKRQQTLNFIYKYSSVKEILNEVFGQSSNLYKQKSRDITSQKPRKTEVVLLYSASGGVGKTTLAMGLCACLENKYKKVLYIEGSRLQTFQHYMKDTSPLDASNLYSKINSSNAEDLSILRSCVRKEEFTYLPSFKTSLLSLGIEFKAYKKIIEYFKSLNEYDYIICDADSSFDEDCVSLIGYADSVVMVAKQYFSYAYSLNRLLSSINISNPDKFIYVCNDFVDEKENALIEHNYQSTVSINEYIRHINGCETLDITGLSENADIQKLAYLLL